MVVPPNAVRQRVRPANTRPKRASNNCMAVQRQLIDTNVLARFFTGEPREMAVKARRLVERADQGEIILVILPVIVAELIYTLESFYEIDRQEVATKLLSFLQSVGIEVIEATRITDALTRCRDRNAHFADAYLCLGRIDWSLRQYRRALKQWRIVAKADPSDSWAIRSLSIGSEMVRHGLIDGKPAPINIEEPILKVHMRYGFQTGGGHQALL